MKSLKIMLPQVLLDWLRKEAETKGISMGEMLRRILDEKLENQKKQNAN